MAYEAAEGLILKSSVESLTQRCREAESAEKVQMSDGKENHDKHYTEERPRPRYNLNRSKDYWVGWALAHCQWATSLSFRELTRYVPPSRMAGLYSPYHERDVQALVEKVVDICRAGKKETNLKSARQRRGLSQSELAEAAQVPLRTLQQYEQGQKDILKANVSYAVSLAHVLGCSVEEILDYV